MINYSSYQVELFSFLKNNKGSVIVNAKAGSGKTTTIIEACNRLSDGLSVLFLAFNTSIVNELRERLPSGTNTMTFNSCGWSAWRSYTGRRYIKINARKTWGIIFDNFKKSDQKTYGSFCAKLVGLAKSVGLTPDSSDHEWFNLQSHHGLLLSSEKASYERGIFLAKRVLSVSIDISDRVCDFDDQLYMPWLRNVGMKKYDVIFVDEVQDTNNVQSGLVERMLNVNGRVIAVGDSNQAIYGFRGADHNAMNNFSDKFDCHSVPLSISYRCAKSIIEEAKRYVPDIESYDGSASGKVEAVTNYSIDTFTTNDAILCRNNAPLISIAYEIISRGKSVNFLGRDIGKGLKALINNMEAKSIDNLSDKLVSWLVRESEKLQAKNQSNKVGMIEDRVNCIEVFIKYLPESKRTVPDLLSAIDYLFRKKNDGVTLSSVHKSKGKEWSRVFILGFDKYMPSKYAKMEWMKIQENNLIYVAITRAKHYLGYIEEGLWTDEPNIITPKIIGEQVKSRNRKDILTGFCPSRS